MNEKLTSGREPTKIHSLQKSEKVDSEDASSNSSGDSVSSSRKRRSLARMERIQLPVFGGANKEYEAWKAAFKLCVDDTSASDHEKLLYLRKYLKGEALNLIDYFGFSSLQRNPV